MKITQPRLELTISIIVLILDVNSENVAHACVFGAHFQGVGLRELAPLRIFWLTTPPHKFKREKGGGELQVGKWV